MDRIRQKTWRFKITLVYLAFLVVGALLILSAYVFAGENVFSPRNATERQLLPQEIIQIDEDTREYVFSGLQIDRENDAIQFCSNHQIVQVYENNSLVYEVNESDGFLVQHQHFIGILCSFVPELRMFVFVCRQYIRKCVIIKFSFCKAILWKCIEKK